MAKTKKSAEGAEEQTASTGYYEEWKVEIAKKKATKLKMLHEKVKITDEEAEILNEGILDGGNTYATMYFKPEAAAESEASQPE